MLTEALMNYYKKDIGKMWKAFIRLLAKAVTYYGIPRFQKMKWCCCSYQYCKNIVERFLATSLIMAAPKASEVMTVFVGLRSRRAVLKTSQYIGSQVVADRGTHG